jgi:hypothetical protein
MWRRKLDRIYSYKCPAARFCDCCYKKALDCLTQQTSWSHQELWLTCYVSGPVPSWRMPSSEMLRHVALVRTDVSEEHSASIIRVTRVGELGTLAVTSNWCALWRNTMYNLDFLSRIIKSEDVETCQQVIWQPRQYDNWLVTLLDVNYCPWDYYFGRHQYQSATFVIRKELT